MKAVAYAIPRSSEKAPLGTKFVQATDLKIRLDSASYCFRPVVFEARENLRRPYW